MGGLAAMIISLQSTMEFITTKGKPALIFDGSRLPLNKRMDNGVCYWRSSKRACPARITIERNDLKQQTAPHNHAVDVVDTQVKGDLERHEKKSQRRNHTSASNLYQSYLLLVSV